MDRHEGVLFERFRTAPERERYVCFCPFDHRLFLAPHSTPGLVGAAYLRGVLWLGKLQQCVRPYLQDGQTSRQLADARRACP